MKNKMLLSLMMCLFVPAAFAEEISIENLEGLPNAVVYSEGVIGGGPPTPEALEEVRARGVGIVIDLRTETDKTAEEEAVVTGLGMTYERIPVSSPSAIGPDEIARLEEILISRGEAGVLLHCASGRRSGAFWKAYEASLSKTT